jgi:hypothetical protein
MADLMFKLGGLHAGRAALAGVMEAPSAGR